MKDKIIKVLRDFFAKYLTYLDVIGSAGFAIGILLYILNIHAAIIVLTVFAIFFCIYHIIHFGYLSRFEEQKTSLEQFMSVMMGFAVAFIAVGSVVKIAGVTEKDKILNIGLIVSVLCEAIVLLYYVLKSDQIKISAVPFIRNTIACIIGACFFLIPLKTSQESPVIFAPQLHSEPILREKKTPDTTENAVELPAAEDETDIDTTQ